MCDRRGNIGLTRSGRSVQEHTAIDLDILRLYQCVCAEESLFEHYLGPVIAFVIGVSIP